MKKIVLLAFVLVFLSMSTVGRFTIPVEASGTITINADGSIDPLDAPINTTDRVTYYLTANITDSIVVKRSNIIIDGNGYTVQGSGSGNGFYWNGINNVTIKNTNIKNFAYGVSIYSSNNSTVSGNTITDNTNCGVDLRGYNNITVSGNTITNNTNSGVSIVSSDNITVSGNTIRNSTYYGVHLLSSNNGTVSGNTITNNTQYGISLSSSNNSVVSGNTIRNSPNYGVSLLSSNNGTVSGNTITNNWHGVSLYLSNNGTVSGNTITNNTSCGVYLSSSNDSVVSGNTITKSINGVLLSLSNNGTVSGNTLINSTCGVSLWSNNSVASGNTITNSTVGVYLSSSNNSVVSGNTITNSTDYGVYLQSSNNSVVYGNTITNNQYGVFLWLSNNSVVYGNTITNNTNYGVYLYRFNNNNKIYHNNFINKYQASASPDSLNNLWDDGYPSGGNYWSNYTGVDANMDGIGDSSYQIDLNNIDHYPLMGRFSDFPVTLGEETYHVTTVCNSTISAFEFDQVNRIIRFNVTGEVGIGFCRACIPHNLMEPPYTVTVDGYDPLDVNYTLYDNGTHRWIYFTYLHSTHEIEIVPEFPTWTSTLLTLIVLTIAVTIYKRRLLKTPIH